MSGRVADVFSGQEGWGQEQWTRFIVIGYGRSRTIKFLKGIQLDKPTFLFVQQKLMGL